MSLNEQDEKCKKEKKKIVTAHLKSNGFDNTAEICSTIEEKVIADWCVFVGHGFDDLLS